ncbi:uncharacterized protein AMSG_04503 [Thecamonas trahens ATCC 50062]|uniref:Zinc/iron permease n=1 Tax=Thecamonas trahens ATCC 50062 TaxID=461836 RepID=A0A0L0DAE9_THETB|nr:hypothetical protein AMSG_04503 [Thecamonas trahens ATCC 50062]KNC48273.1 hypothetical protein AMSG_04503 [Thecamonas trahens ATCC 50062]|eukprot:XP_013758840.1 hypothetical protein AMSG_04503 [Thecamonas trahens ATCC 50062]
MKFAQEEATAVGLALATGLLYAGGAAAPWMVRTKAGRGAGAGRLALANAAAAGAMLTLSLAHMWPEGLELLTDGDDSPRWAALLGGGLLVVGALIMMVADLIGHIGHDHSKCPAATAAAAAAGPVSAPLVGEASPLRFSPTINTLDLENGRADEPKTESVPQRKRSPRATLYAGTVGVCLHAIPAGVSLYVLALRALAPALLLAGAIAAHTGVVGFSTTLPLAMAHSKVTTADVLLVGVSALSNAIGVLLGILLPARLVRNTVFQGSVLTTAAGVLSAMAITHLLPDMVHVAPPSSSRFPTSFRVLLAAAIATALILAAFDP